MSRPSPDLAEFVRLVDIHVTPHMTRLRYVRLHASAGQGESEAILTAMDRHPLRALLRRFIFLRVCSRPAPTVEFTFGYEAEGFEVAERLYPADPHTGEEVWLSFEPESGELSFGVGLLKELTARHATEEDAVLLTSPDTGLPERLRTIDGLLARYVAEMLGA